MLGLARSKGSWSIQAHSSPQAAPSVSISRPDVSILVHFMDGRWPCVAHSCSDWPARVTRQDVHSNSSTRLHKQRPDSSAI